MTRETNRNADNPACGAADAVGRLRFEIISRLRVWSAVRKT